MKKKTIFTVLILSIMAIAVLTSCSVSGKVVGDDYHAQGLYRVYFYYNGGSLSDSAYKEAYVDQNAKLPLPGVAGSPVSNPSKAGNTFLGWYQVQADLFDSYEQPQYIEENGQQRPVLDSRGRHVHKTIFYVKGHDPNQEGQSYLTLSDYEGGIEFDNKQIFIKEWNFELDKVREDTVLVALWQSTREYVFLTEEYKLVDPDYDINDFDPILDKDLITYLKNYTRRVSEDGSIREFEKGGALVPKKTNYQIEGFYLDYNYNTPIPYVNGKYQPPEEFKEDGTPKRVPIYIQWLDDKYEIVENISSFANSNGVYSFTPITAGKTSLYFKANIDFGGATLTFPQNFSSEIRGNNNKVVNFAIRISENNRTAPTTYSAFFGRLESTAIISDISFESFTIQFDRSVNPPVSQFTHTINLFAGEGIPSNCTVVNTHIRDFEVYDAPYFSMELALFGEGATQTGKLVDNKPLRFYTEKPITSGYANLTLSQFANDFGVNFSGVQGNTVSAKTDADILPYPFASQCEIQLSRDSYEAPTMPNLLFAGNVYQFVGWFDINGNRLEDLIESGQMPETPSTFKAAWYL